MCKHGGYIIFMVTIDFTTIPEFPIVKLFDFFSPKLSPHDLAIYVFSVISGLKLHTCSQLYENNFKLVPVGTCPSLKCTVHKMHNDFCEFWIKMMYLVQIADFWLFP